MSDKITDEAKIEIKRVSMSHGTHQTSSSRMEARGHHHGIQSKQLSQRNRKDSKWEILTSLDIGTPYAIKPKKLEGWMSKRRKWPLKGWHKRFFVLDNGVLLYGKSLTDVNRGRTHGRIDVGLAVISAKTELFRIDIDDEECIHHLKAGDMESFGLWLEQLQQHRFYQQNEFNTSGGGGGGGGTASPSADDLVALGGGGGQGGQKGTTRVFMSPHSSLTRGARPVTSLAQEFSSMDDHMTSQLVGIQQLAVNLGLMAQKLEDECYTQTGGGTKQKNFFGLRKKKSNPVSTSSSKSECSSRSSTLTSQNQDLGRHSPLFSENIAETPETMPCSSAAGSSTSLSAMSALSLSNPSLASSLVSSASQMPHVVQHSSRPISCPTDSGLGSKQSSTSSKISSNATDTSPSTGSGSVVSNASRDELITLAQELQQELASLVRNYSADRDKVKALVNATDEQLQQQKTATLGQGSQHQQVAQLRNALNQSLQQNSMLKARLQKIHLDADVSDIMTVNPLGSGSGTLFRGTMNHSLSYSSSCISEFFDAREYITDDGAQSEYSSDDDMASLADEEEEEDDTSTDDEIFPEGRSPKATTAPVKQRIIEATQDMLPGTTASISRYNAWTGRRQKLPATRPDTSGLNLWNLLCKNIGKDLSKISMPVTLNEPLSVLQRLCEELEYSELLDKAAETSTAVERMTLVTAFVVSAYGSSTARAGYKPFNPLLGETFECVRDDKGFRYISEQVSHHPPISACHATGRKWKWQQEFRVKTKFWGKSMEFQPDGLVTLILTLPDGRQEEYTWNKITTCIHNLFGGDRWADLYGDCKISCRYIVNDENNASPTALSCKMEFIRASGYWTSGNRHEVQGTITDPKGNILQHLFGKCTEALYCGKAPSARCVWRPGALPDDAYLNYGFSRFAIELNEILETERKCLPNTDTRFRPDQRCLEEGQITDAETLKLKLEQAQRERRQSMEENDGEKHNAMWFRNDGNKGSWAFKGDYWTFRTDPGFSQMTLLKLW